MAEQSQGARVRWNVLLPVEHGSWSLALEPIALALIAAPSVAGTALAVAVLAVFLARRPLALLHARPPLPTFAARALAGCTIAVVVSLVIAAKFGPAHAFVTLLFAAPPAAGFVYFEARRQTREEPAEISGALAFAIIPSTMALLAGWSWGPALALGFTAAGRSLPTIATLRAFLRSRRGDVSGRARAGMVSAAFCVAALTLAGVGLLPWTIVVLMMLQLARSAWLLGPRCPDWPAMKLGAIETAIGAGHVIIAGLAWGLG